ncbi:UvrD-helicase domain-containing protein [Alkalihalophilus marmarensis]|jgi:ATP-dependent exoDNAse (exonuclease V) beta subunit|uniref:UvrD-helicase domain-containing protein n=1 Tax=Alkalihalophilus marmarensis TaxID=521377 RepID=UPI00204183E5|nr:UvrD-helicase domain-containing protein [Alkalihalophilus marmarensis]MCM3488005.1 UvrD-helicase domain-containing protein [Alkalihalophilus marmarensis]
MEFNIAQTSAITNEQSLVVIAAGAGSGKTRVLTERIMYLLEKAFHEPASNIAATIEEVAAITFTEKAAREMKDRVRKRISEKEALAQTEAEAAFWREQKELVERAHISTFHSFCQQLLGQYAMAAKLPPKIRIIDEVEAKQLKRDVLKKHLQDVEFTASAKEFFSYMSKDQFISTMEDIHASISELVIGEDAVLQLQAEDMLHAQIEAVKEKQRKKVEAFHRAALDLLPQFPPAEGLTKAQAGHVERLQEAFLSPPSPSRPNEYMDWLIGVMPKRTDKKWEEAIPALFQLFEEHWKPLKDDWKAIGGEVEMDETTSLLLGHFLDLLGDFHLAYKREKELRGVVDFSDLQQKAVSLLLNKEIQEACQKQFRHMLVDEFQDTNRLQLEMLERINPSYRFIVGDTKQSIYRFRGANVRLMNELEQAAVEQENAEAIEMNINYRTCKPIIDGVNALFQSAMTDHITESYQTRYAALSANREAEQPGQKQMELLLLNKEETEEEADPYEALAHRINEMITSQQPRVFKGESWQAPAFKDMAVLIPARTDLLKLERAFSKQNIPYTVYGGIGFYERQEIIDFITLLRWMNRPFEDVYVLSLLRSPLIGLTMNDFVTIAKQKEATQSFADYLYQLSESPPKTGLVDSDDLPPQQVLDAALKLKEWLLNYVPFSIKGSPGETFDRMIKETGLVHSLLIQSNGLQKVKNVEKLIQMIEQSHLRSLEEIIHFIDERMALNDKEGEAEMERTEGDAVNIMTIHASKGLEFPIVYLPQLERSVQGDKGSVRFDAKLGVVWSLEEETDNLEVRPKKLVTPGFELVKESAGLEAEEESKRLFYVAATRAKDYLVMIGNGDGAKKSWLHLLEEARDCGPLEDYITVVNEISKQLPHHAEKRVYKGTELAEKKEVLYPLSVSEIMTFIHQPEEYYEKYVLGVNESRRLRSDVAADQETRVSHVDPAVVGTLVHRACELRDYGFRAEEAITEAMNYVDELNDTASVKDSYEQEVTELMETYNEAQQKELGTPVKNEWSFATEIAGAEVIGEIDKIVEKDGCLHIIDFKTNRIKQSGSEWLAVYDVQLYLYKMAYEQETGHHISTMSLYVLRDKEQPLHTIRVEEEKEESIKKAIQRLVHLRKSNADLTDYVM